MPLNEVLDVAICSDTGIVRTNNEDAVFVDAELGLAILADGMGGYRAGEVASEMATHELARSFRHLLRDQDAAAAMLADPQQRIADEIRAVNALIYQAAQSEAKYAGMGTTLVFACLLGHRLFVAHVGDSRAYRWRDGQLLPLTKDHSVLQAQLDHGLITEEAARHAANRHLVTRALGVDLLLEVDVAEHAMRPDDVLLLCSDGLNDMLDDDEIAHVFRTHGNDLTDFAEQLVEAANQKGGRDNVSVILLRRPDAPVSLAHWWQRCLRRLSLGGQDRKGAVAWPH